MAYRVYDIEEKIWLKDNIFLNPNGELFFIKRSAFGWTKLPLALSGDRYVYHRNIGLQDKNEKEIYEGDYIRAHVAEDKDVIGVVAFVQDLSAYVILCEENNEFYTLGTEVCEFIEVVGNVFDGYNE